MSDMTREERIAEHIRIAVIDSLESCALTADHMGAMVTAVREKVLRHLPGAKHEVGSGMWDSMIKEVAANFWKKGAWPVRLKAKDDHLAARSKAAKSTPSPEPLEEEEEEDPAEDEEGVDETTKESVDDKPKPAAKKKPTAKKKKKAKKKAGATRSKKDSDESDDPE